MNRLWVLCESESYARPLSNTWVLFCLPLKLLLTRIVALLDIATHDHPIDLCHGGPPFDLRYMDPLDCCELAALMHASAATPAEK